MLSYFLHFKMLFFAFMLFCIYASFFILFVSTGRILVSFEFSVRVARLLVNFRGLFFLVFVVLFCTCNVLVSVVCTNYGSL